MKTCEPSDHNYQLGTLPGWNNVTRYILYCSKCGHYRRLPKEFDTVSYQWVGGTSQVTVQSNRLFDGVNGSSIRWPDGGTMCRQA